MDKERLQCAMAIAGAKLARLAAESTQLTATPGNAADALENIRLIVAALQSANDLPHFAELNLAPLPPALRGYLLRGMQAILDGTEPAAALGLKTPHRARDWGNGDSRLVALMVWQCVHGGMSETAAAKRVVAMLKSPMMRQTEPYSAIRLCAWKTAIDAYRTHKIELDLRHGITRRTVR